MRITYQSQAEAQAKADLLHSSLIATNPAYAESAQLYLDHPETGGTARWAVPQQDLDEGGLPVDNLWHITVDERSRPLMPAEASQIPEWSQSMNYIRVIRPIPSGTGKLAVQSVTWGGYVDWIQPGTVADVPADAVYAAALSDGVYKTVVQNKAGFVFKYNPAGWIPFGQPGSDWPYPS